MQVYFLRCLLYNSVLSNTYVTVTLNPHTGVSTTQFYTNIFSSPKEWLIFLLYIQCHLIFFIFSFHIKPEGIEKEETFNSLICATGKCQKETKFSCSTIAKVYGYRMPLGECCPLGSETGYFPMYKSKDIWWKTTFSWWRHREVKRPQRSWLILRTKAGVWGTGFLLIQNCISHPSL